MADPTDLSADVIEAAKAAAGTRRAEEEKARRTEALSLRLAGMSYEAIGDRLGISEQGAYDMVARTLERAENRNVAMLRSEENARLDRVQMSIWPKVLQGDPQAIATYIRISQERSKLNGLYAPSKVAISMTIRQEMEEALQGLEALVLHEHPITAIEERRSVELGPDPESDER